MAGADQAGLIKVGLLLAALLVLVLAMRLCGTLEPEPTCEDDITMTSSVWYNMSGKSRR